MSIRYSTIFEHKLPAFIRDDPAYTRFIEFFNAYYQWFDDTYDIYGLGEKLDIDAGYEQFYSYYAADFLPYFPDIDTIAADKIKLIKIVKELYKAKGIPESFKFLFRALYNKNVEVIPTAQFVLKPSDGKWIVPKSIKIKSLDESFLNINNFKVLGEDSKSIGIIEKSKINGRFIQIYLSNIQRVFNSAETIRIIDYDNKDVYFLNGEYVKYNKTPPAGAILLTSKIIGAISNISINPARRGIYYKVGDPVVIHGGFSKLTENPIGASAYVSEVTTGQIQQVIITKSGYGYRPFPNSSIEIFNANGMIDTVANCIVSLVDESKPANIAYVSSDCIEDNLAITLNGSYNFAAPANKNTALKDCFSFIEYPGYPVAAVTVRNGGGGYYSPPNLIIHSSFNANTEAQYRQELDELGILAPIQIINGGLGYTTSDTIIFTGGSGCLAFANVTSTNAYGSITSVEYYYNSSQPYTVGGMGYTNSDLPIISVNTSTGHSANLIVPSILGTGVEYTIETDKIGAITKIGISENGEDYISAPNTSLRVQDIVVTGTTVESINPLTCIVYQGENVATPTFSGYVDSITSLYFDAETNYQLFSIRVYDYRGVANASIDMYAYDTDLLSTVSTLSIQANYQTAPFKNGVRIYGDGSAKSTAKFLNGLIEDPGKYLNSDGQPSAHSVLQDDIYNLSTYILETEKDFDSYKTTVQNLLHPLGTRIVAKNLLKSNAQINIQHNSELYQGVVSNNITAVLLPGSDNKFSNTLSIHSSADINTIFSVNDKLAITGNNFFIYSTISSINIIDREIELKDYSQYKFANIYSGYTQSNTIIITKANFVEDKYSVNSFVGIGDTISIGTNAETLINIIGNTLYFTNVLNLSGSLLNSANVSISKSLSSNNITVYKTV